MRVWWLGLALCACGSVSNDDKHDAAVGIDGHVDAKVDSPLDAFSGCLTDEFSGTSLDAHWVTTVGSAPTLTVGTGIVTITDAAFAATATPTQPNESWLYDFDSDKGNQLRWDAPVGTRDFTLTAVLGWDTANADLTLGGFGLVSAGNQLEVLVTGRDSSGGTTGYPHAQIRLAGPTDHTWAGTYAQTVASTTFVVRRVGTQIIVEHDGSVVLTDDNPASIEGLVIETIRYKDDNQGQYTYGTVTLDRVSLCM
jgi:hypothetical protein